MPKQLSRRRAMAAGLAAAMGGAPELGAAPAVLRSADKVTIAVDPYGSLEELSAAPYPLQAAWDSEPRRSAHTALYAARELRHYLCRLAGLAPDDPQAFRVSPQSDSKPGRGIHLIDLARPAGGHAAHIVARERLADRLRAAGSFAIVPDGPRLYLVGRDRAGLLYSVYHFLELQGVRWYAPGEMGEVVPAAGRIALPVAAVISAPAFATRGFYAWEPRGNRDFHVWMARNCLNYWTAADPDHAFMSQVGLQVSAGSHWLLGSLLNPATYFAAHPEWYGLYQGKRTPFEGIRGVNICSSNADAMAELCRRIVDELARGQWRDLDILEFWVLDTGKWCECTACTKLGTPTDRLLLMVHQVRQAIARALTAGVLRRDVRIFFPIYEETLPAPTRPLPPDFDYRASVGTLFPIGRCYGHALDDPACTETNARIWQTILDWWKGGRFYRGEFVMGEYYNVSSTKSLPVLYTRIMARDIPMYRHRGVGHFHFMHACTRLLGPKRLNQYLLARLLWNPEAEVPALVDRYCRDFYGPAAGPMREFYERLDYGMSAITQWKSGRLRLTTGLAGDRDPLFPLAHLQLRESHPSANDGVDLEESVAALARCRTIMDQVLAAAHPEPIRQRLREDDRNLRYAWNTVNLYYLMARALMARRAGDLEKARAYYRAGVPHAKGLKEEVGILQTSSEHANARDGLDASQVEIAWRRLGEQLGLTGALP